MANPNGNPNWKPGQSGNPATQWKPGQGGPRKTKLQREFDVALEAALVTETPEKAAKFLANIVWNAVKESQPWAVKMLMDKFAPSTLNLSVSKAEPDVNHMQQVFLESIAELPDEERYAIARKLFDAERAINGGSDDVQ
jgi:hypothetical protein